MLTDIFDHVASFLEGREANALALTCQAAAVSNVWRYPWWRAGEPLLHGSSSVYRVHATTTAELVWISEHAAKFAALCEVAADKDPYERQHFATQIQRAAACARLHRQGICVHHDVTVYRELDLIWSGPHDDIVVHQVSPGGIVVRLEDIAPVCSEQVVAFCANVPSQVKIMPFDDIVLATAIIAARTAVTVLELNLTGIDDHHSFFDEYQHVNPVVVHTMMLAAESARGTVVIDTEQIGGLRFLHNICADSVAMHQFSEATVRMRARGAAMRILYVCNGWIETRALIYMLDKIHALTVMHVEWDLELCELDAVAYDEAVTRFGQMALRYGVTLTFLPSV